MFIQNVMSDSIESVKLQSIICELSLRKENYLGSGLGGDKFQALTIMNMKHVVLLKQGVTIFANEDVIYYGSEFIKNASAKDIRNKLNEIFESMPNKYKYLAAAISSSTFNNTEPYNQYLSIINSIINGEDYDLSNLDNISITILSFMICSRFSSNLD
jgi:hypothetical protein